MSTMYKQERDDCNQFFHVFKVQVLRLIETYFIGLEISLLRRNGRYRNDGNESPRCLQEKVFLKMSQISQENTCAEVSF